MQAAITSADQGFRQRLPHLAMFGLVVAYASLLVMTFLMGIWLVDVDGQPIATDFVSFWAAGKLVLQGHAADAYDWAIHKTMAVENGVNFDGRFTFQYPPTFLAVTPALALFPYPAALVAWMAVGLPLYISAIRLITGTWNTTLAALAWPAVLWNMVLGQNGFLTAALLGAGIALIEKRPALSGILFGLLTYKPQFGLLIPIALVAGGHWRVIGWAALTTTVLVAVSTAILGTDAWAAFIDSAFRINTAILIEGGTDFSELQSVYGYVRALGGGTAAAWTAHGVLVLLLAAGIVWIWREDMPFDVKAAALATATILASPYAFIYDFVALAIPLAFLGRTGFSFRETAVIILAGALVGWGPADHLATALIAALLVLGLAIAKSGASNQVVRF
jgi:hypothetical protein